MTASMLVALVLTASIATGLGMLPGQRPRRRSRTQLAAALRELKSQRALLAALTEQLDVAVVATDPAGQVVLRNHAAVRASQHARRTGHDGPDCSVACRWLHDPTPPQADSPSRPQAEEVILEGPASQPQHFAVRIAQYGDPCDPNGSVMTGHDLTTLRRRETELARDATELAALAEATHALHAETDATGALCRAAQQIADSPYVALLELDAKGSLHTRAQAGAALSEITLTEHEDERIRGCLRSGHVTFLSSDTALPGPNVGDPTATKSASAGLRTAGLLSELTVALSESIQVAALLPVSSHDKTVGVLVVAFQQLPRAGQAGRLALLELLAKDAGLAVERQRLLAELTAQTLTDPLTGLANRRRWDTELARELARAQRSGQPLTVAMLDLDHFKSFNDTHGHGAGDSLLRGLGQAWLLRLRATDLAARIGGDEFAILLPGCDTEQARTVLRPLLHAVPHDQTCSGGLATWHGEDADTLLAHADTALYQAKADGRARVQSSVNTVDLTSPAPTAARRSSPRDGQSR